MTALPKPDLPADLRAEMARLQRCGFPLLPLGGGTDGKAPLLAKWAASRLPLRNILGPMHRTGIAVYGIRLDMLTVIDCDMDDPGLVRQIEARFGPSAVHVATPRGRHLYYLRSNHLPNLRSEGLPVDVKSGASSYVAGPLSMRPDGGSYRPVKGVLGVDKLSALVAAARPSAGLDVAAAVGKGERHKALVKEALRTVEYVDSLDELAGNLLALRDHTFMDPASVPDAEVRSVAEWAWRCRLEDRIYAGRASEFRVSRIALDLLKGHPQASDALSLYVRLQAEHGHHPGKRFPLSSKAMRDVGFTALSRDRFRTARDLLLSVGLLKPAGKHFAGSVPRTYVLAMPHAPAVNVTFLPSLSLGGEG